MTDLSAIQLIISGTLIVLAAIRTFAIGLTYPKPVSLIQVFSGFLVIIVLSALIFGVFGALLRQMDAFIFISLGVSAFAIIFTEVSVKGGMVLYHIPKWFFLSYGTSKSNADSEKIKTS